MWYDILVVCILLFFMAKGAARGLVWQLAGIAGILLCVTFAGTASKVIGPHIKLDPPTNQWAVMFITYLLASFVAFGFARTLNGWIDQMEMKEYNRHLGAIFGLLKGALLVLIMTFMVVTFSEKTRDMLKDSKSAHIAAKVIHQIEPIVPDKLHQAVAKYLDMFERTGFGKSALANEVEELLPDGTEEAPVGDDTVLGEPAPFSPFDLLPQTQSRKVPAQTEDGPAELTDLATELTRTLGSKVTRMVEDELKVASPQVKARLEQNIADALQSANSRAKRQLQERLLNEGTADSLVQLLDDWAADTLASGEVTPPVRSITPAPKNTTRNQSTTPVTRTQTPAKPAAPTANAPRTILDEIVASKSQFSSIQKKLKTEYTEVLEMLPAQVSQGVIEDWYGDLTNRDSNDDIDPETDANTPLDGRIIRQLSAMRVPESKLPVELQNRLKQFRLTADGTGVLR